MGPAESASNLNQLEHLFREQWQTGKPLARYADALAAELEFQRADQCARYWETIANFAPFFGDIENGEKAYFNTIKAHRSHVPRDIDETMRAYSPKPAVDQIAYAAKTQSVIMVGEEHMNPQTRSLLLPLIKRLSSCGFRYFAAETFSTNLDETVKAGCTLHQTGWYTEDPIFAEAVNEAIRLGYKLIPYEAVDEPSESKSRDALARQNWRERRQAENLKHRIFDKDPSAKVLVWAGRAHVAKVQTAGSEWSPMALEFKKLTKIDPLCIYLPEMTSLTDTAYERPEYKYVADRKWLDKPKILTKSTGELFGTSGGMVDVFFPRTITVKGRADWLSREVERVSVPLPEFPPAPDVLMAETFNAGHPDQAVPCDRVLIWPNRPKPCLMLTPNCHYDLKISDRAGHLIFDGAVSSMRR